MTSSMTIMPGGISRRPPHFFVLAGCSGSRRAGGRMQALNIAIASRRHPARGNGPGLT